MKREASQLGIKFNDSNLGSDNLILVLIIIIIITELCIQIIPATYHLYGNNKKNM